MEIKLIEIKPFYFDVLQKYIDLILQKNRIKKILILSSE